MTDKICHYKRIDKLNRLVIPKEICNKANINCNDNIAIVYNDELDTILLKKDNNNKVINNLIINVFKPLYTTLNYEIVITSSSNVVEVFCDKKSKLKEVKNKSVSNELINLIKNDYISTKELYNIQLTRNAEISSRCIYIALKDSSYNIGSAIIFLKEDLDSNLLSYILNQINTR